VASPSSSVVRVCGLFGMKGSREKGGNFVDTMPRLRRDGRPIRAVDDQVLAPTSTVDLAEKLTQFVLTGAPSGVYHMTAAASCSWYEFARPFSSRVSLK
jgi:dTDP-4-dehydrorhamnose reductase